MGLYIAGMDMPIFEDQSWDIRQGTNGKWYIVDGKWYEIIAVPPHGRLVEDTAVIDQIDDWLDSVGTVFLGHGMSYYGELIGCVEDAPTIIPAEEADNGKLRNV